VWQCRSRFEFHDLIRRYASERAELDESTDRQTAIRRLLDWYLHAAANADTVLVPQRPRDFLAPYETSVPVPRFGSAVEALGWFEREYDCLRSVVGWAAGNGWAGYAWRIAIASTTFFDARIPWRDGIEFYESALHGAQRDGEPLGEAFVLNSLGCIYLDGEDWQTAADYYERSLARFREVSHVRGEAMALGNLGLTLGHLGRYELGRRYSTQALGLYRRLGSPRGVAMNLDNLAIAFAAAGEHRKAIGCGVRAAAIFRELGDLHNLAMIQHHLGNTYMSAGELRKAIHALNEGIRGYRAMGSRRWEAFTIIDLGKALCHTGHASLGKGLLESALSILTEFADPKAKEIQAIINGLPDTPEPRTMTGVWTPPAV
jgi:tetratricopeptide (TPR) repeat protein